MASGISVANICKARTLRHQDESRNNVKAMSNVIEMSADPHSGDGAQRPFMIPLGHDPFDVWHLILGNIEDPKEVTKLWEVCPLFREIFKCKQKYVQTRLPQIVKLILDKRPKFLLENEEGPENTYAQARIMAIKSKSTRLDLRLVSRQCRDSAEEIIFQRACLKGKMLYLTLETADQIKTIVDHLQGKQILTDSFFPPNLQVDEEVALENPEREFYWEGLVILLKLIGKRVKTFLYNSMDPIQRTYEKLSELVLSMPNLETLELNQGVPLDFTLFPVRRHSPALLPNFEDLLPFSRCPTLRAFIQTGTILPMPYVLRVLEGSPRIRVISLSKRSRPEDLPDPFQLKLMLQNAECLHTPMYTSLVWHLEFQLPLKEIVFHGGVATWTFSSTEIFKFLNQFRDTLERVELEDVGATGKYFLDLPNLRFFKWMCKTSFKDLYFLLHAGRLEEIRLVPWFFPNAEADLFIEKVTNGFDGLTLWEVFPRLNRFLIESPFTNDEFTDMCRP